MSMIRRIVNITGGATGASAAVARMLSAKTYNVLIYYSRSSDAAAGDDSAPQYQERVVVCDSRRFDTQLAIPL